MPRDRLKEYALTSGELGAAAAQTTAVVLLPVLLRDETTSTFLIGFAVGGEGVFALLIPFVIGALSDRLPRSLTHRFGRRSFFLLWSAPVMAATLVMMPFVSGFWPTVGVAFAFFCAAQVFFTPLWTLTIDAVPDDRRARVQGARGALRAAGLGYGLVLGGALFSIWEPLPFLLAALLVLVCAAGTVLAARTLADGDDPPRRRGPGTVRELLTELNENPDAKRLLAANALWNGAIDGVRPYFLLFGSVVLGIGPAVTSAWMLFLVIGIGLGSILVGRLGDHSDRARLLARGVALTTLAMAAGFFMRNIIVGIPILLAAGVGAAAIIALPYPIYASLTDAKRAGEHTGVFVVSLSAGRLLAPMIVGAVIDFARPFMRETEGYPAMWLVAALMAGGGWLMLRKVKGT
jgi:MFS family permease